MIVRKRKAGGGRKPKGPIRSKSEVFTTRITPDTRASIEAEAERSGQSISQVAERLLLLGMETRRRRQNNRSLRALCFLVEALALRIGSVQWQDVSQYKDPRRRKIIESLQEDWRTDPFRYRALTLAVQSLFDALKPSGEIKLNNLAEVRPEDLAPLEVSPALIELMKHIYTSPENLAAYHFANLWTQMNREHPLSENERELMGHGSWVGEMMREEFYGLQDARNDLALGSHSKGDNE
jgi:hypothetical protein